MNTSTNPQKYLFDHVFDRPAAIDVNHDDKITCSPDEWAHHHDTGYAAGYEQGRANAINSIEQETQSIVLAVQNSVSDFIAHQEIQDHTIGSGFQNLFSVMVHRFFPIFAQQHGIHEINALITDTLGAVKNQSLIVFVPTDLKDRVSHYFGNNDHITLKTDDTLGPSDVRIDWSQGSIDRRLDLVSGALNDLIEKGDVI